jgi:hypothetical protein
MRNFVKENFKTSNHSLKREDNHLNSQSIGMKSAVPLLKAALFDIYYFTQISLHNSLHFLNEMPFLLMIGKAECIYWIIF